ncbi:hypothetical protein EDC94DRAFT_615911 [Helicostylum pulchrum]|nr:hypothetical protein EDC94DRAFT_615911 [Helicostylum pulchrum]
MKILRAWIESSNTLCLDLRTKLDFKQRHLKSSTNIPLSQLVLRQSELPPKRLPFAVIEPINEKGCSSWLVEHGWQVSWIVWEGNLQWKEIEANQWTDNDDQHVLFQPSPFLSSNIELLEQGLKERDEWTFLDVGCGSGRDVGWLLTRNKKWRASAFDYLAGAMVRTDILVRNLHVAQQLDILAQVKLMNNGQWQLISNAWWNEQHNQDTKELQDSQDEITRRLAMVELENSNKKELYTFKELYHHLLPKTKYDTFDLILNIRFLSRPFLLEVPQLLNVGGYFIISHFVDDERYNYKQPKKSLRLQVNEISELYGKMSQMEVIKDVIEEIEDGRPVNSIIVRRKF